MKGRLFKTELFLFLSLIISIVGEIKGLSQADSIQSGPVIIEKFPVELYSPSSGVKFYRDGILFLSNSRHHNKIPAKHLSFGKLEVYYAKTEDSVIYSAKVFSPRYSFSYPCDALTFSEDERIMYFTALSGKDEKEKIYQAILNSENQWEISDSPIELCKEAYVYTHPALSKDGTILVFSSDQPGSHGKLDLFLSRKTTEGWSEAVNLGKEINTMGIESFPVFDESMNLFFSSDKLPGFGGFDIYCARYNGNSWDKAMNLTQHINSVDDEFAFVLNLNDGKSGFLSKKSQRNASEPKLYRIFLHDQFIMEENTLSASLINLAMLESPSVKTDEGLISEEVFVIDSVNLSGLPDVADVVEENDGEVKKPDTLIAENKGFADNTRDIQLDVSEIQEEVVVEKDSNPEVIYRVQCLSSTRSKEGLKLTIDGKEYETWEYFYKGAYRITVGEFGSLSEARVMQTKCRKLGYPQAFVAAFRDGERSLDPELFRNRN